MGSFTGDTECPGLPPKDPSGPKGEGCADTIGMRKEGREGENPHNNSPRKKNSTNIDGPLGFSLFYSVTSPPGRPTPKDLVQPKVGFKRA